MAGSKSVLNSAKEAGIDAGIAVVGGGLLGSVAGKYGMLVGAPLLVWGWHKNNRYAKALGLGTMAATGYQTATGTAGLGNTEDYGTEGMEGFDFNAAKTGAINRVGGWFANVKTKLFIGAKAAQATSGLGEAESTQYFENPLSVSGYPAGALEQGGEFQAPVVGLSGLGAGISSAGLVI